VSFSARVKNDSERLQLDVEKARFYGLPVPSSWLSKPLNKALNDYLDFLYQDERYQGFETNIEDNTINLDLQFR
jgi:hypothetical protein